MQLEEGIKIDARELIQMLEQIGFVVAAAFFGIGAIAASNRRGCAGLHWIYEFQVET